MLPGTDVVLMSHLGPRAPLCPGRQEAHRPCVPPARVKEHHPDRSLWHLLIRGGSKDFASPQGWVQPLLQ